MRCLGAGPHADLPDDRSSTWMRGQSEITRKISNIIGQMWLRSIRWNEWGQWSLCDLCPAVWEWDWYCVCHLVLCPSFSPPTHSQQGHLYFWFSNITINITTKCAGCSIRHGLIVAHSGQCWVRPWAGGKESYGQTKSFFLFLFSFIKKNKKIMWCS